MDRVYGVAVMTNVHLHEFDRSRFGNPDESRHQGLSIRNSGGKAGPAKSKKALAALLSIVPKELQPQYWQGFLGAIWEKSRAGIGSNGSESLCDNGLASPPRALPTMVRTGGGGSAVAGLGGAEPNCSRSSLSTVKRTEFSMP
jgi:hypothetical protein